MRDLFPMPLIDRHIASECIEMVSSLADIMSYLDAVIVGLNSLYGVQFHDLAVGTPTLAQRTSHSIVITAAIDLHRRLVLSIHDRAGDGWAHFEKGGTFRHPDLDAEAVSVPESAGTCNPQLLIRPSLSALVAAETIFPPPHVGLNRFGNVTGKVRPEYVKLTVRQLRCGMLRLASQCTGGASVFAVGKAGGKQRVVWNGTVLSASASRPPPPRHLADPAAFSMLDIASAAVLRVTKRDCRTWFDQLALTDDIGNFFGRPSVTRLEMNQYGIDNTEILALGGDAHSVSFFFSVL